MKFFYGLLQKVAFQIGGGKVDLLMNSVEKKNRSEKEKENKKENLVSFLTTSK